MKLLLVSHGMFAEGLADILNNFLGTGGVAWASVTLDGGVDHLRRGVEAFLAGCEDGEQVVVCSDMLGGSANQTVFPLIAERPNTYLVAGMNLPLVFQLNMLGGSDIDIEQLRTMVEEAKTGIMLVNDLSIAADDDDE